MGTKTAEVVIATPLLQVINPALTNIMGKTLDGLVADTNTAIERGVKTVETARDAETMTQSGRQAIKAINAIRLDFTRPIDDGKKRLMDEVKSLLKPLVDANDKLNKMGMDRLAELRVAQAKAEAEAAEAQRLADKKAFDEEQRRIKISKSQGGTGENIKPVVAEKVAQPVNTLQFTNTVKVRSIVSRDKIQAAIDEGIRTIQGVKIFKVWQFEVTDSKAVPEEYRKVARA